jgi:hypothetical protein
MKRFLNVFALTPAEQRLIIFVVLLLVVGAWLKHRRDMSNEAAPVPPPIISPSPSA